MQILILLVVMAAYATLILSAVGYGPVMLRGVAGIPLALLHVVGMLFLVGRPWSFTAYLDQVIEKNRRNDAAVAKKYLGQEAILASFKELEGEMRRRNANGLRDPQGVHQSRPPMRAHSSQTAA
jgi:hypothetical protein